MSLAPTGKFREPPAPLIGNLDYRAELSLVLRLATGVMLALTVAGYAGGLYWLFDLMSHFRLPLLWMAGVALAGLLVLRSWKWAAVAGLVVLLNGASIHGRLFQSSTQVPVDGATIVRIFYTNVLSSNDDAPGLASQILQADPDVILLVEINERWLTDLDEVTADYPHRVEVPRADNFGIAGYSRLPLTLATAFPLIADSLGLGVPALQLVVETPDGPVQLLAVHTVPPVSARASAGRNEQLAQIADRVQGATLPTAVVGDLNITPFSPQFSRFVQGSSAAGEPPCLTTGLTAAEHPLSMGTWMAGLPAPLRLPIDHCLVGSGLQVAALKTGEPFGSDHRPLICQIALPKQR